MKTSNKLIITLASALFVIPLLGMIVISKMYYKPASSNDFLEKSQNNLPLKIKATNRVTTKFDKPFHTVNLVNGNNSYFEIHLIKDEEYGVKTTDIYNEFVNLKIEDGVLKISLKDDFLVKDFRNRLILLIYAPDFMNLNINNCENVNLIGKADILNLEIKNCGYFNIEDLPTKKTIVVNQDTVSSNIYNETIFNNLNVNVYNSNFSLSSLRLKSLSINAKSSVIELNGFKDGPSNIDNFSIDAERNSSVKLKNINFIKTKAEFSDDTKLEVPTSLLKKLLKD